ncbi:MAG: stalk domain-containing protein [bacterium]
MGKVQLPPGVQLSPDDRRNFTVGMFAKAPAAFPRKFSLAPLVKTKDQKMVSACVAGALAMLLEYQLMQLGVYVNLSMAYGYANREEDDWQGSGMVPHEALKLFQKDGCCLEEMFPGIADYSFLKSRITPEMRANALQYRIGPYYRVYTPAEIKTAIMTFMCPVLVVIPISWEFMAYQGGKMPLPVFKEGEKKDYHAVLYIGWDDDTQDWEIQHSWPYWDGDGVGKLPYGYPWPEAWGVAHFTDPVSRKPAERIELFAGQKRMRVNGKELMLDSVPRLVDGRLQFPLRHPFEAAGYYVEWIEAEQKMMALRQS